MFIFDIINKKERKSSKNFSYDDYKGNYDDWMSMMIMRMMTMRIMMGRRMLMVVIVMRMSSMMTMRLMLIVMAVI